MYSRRHWLGKSWSRWSPTSNQWFFFFGFIQMRDTLSINGEHLRVAEVKSFSAIPKSMRSVDGDRNGANLKKVVSLAGLHHSVKSIAFLRYPGLNSVGQNAIFWIHAILLPLDSDDFGQFIAPCHHDWAAFGLWRFRKKETSSSCS